MSSSQNAFLQHLDAAAKEIESVLEKLLSTAPLEGELSRPARLIEAMR